ncbi:Hypothetical protein NocV09_02900340 [Nannochloropsis oceanica]
MNLPPSPELDKEYDKMSLDFLDDENCPLCRMMKASPCYHHFRRFHQCVEFHLQKGDKKDETSRHCGPYAALLNDCLQANAAFFPKEVIQQR